MWKSAAGQDFEPLDTDKLGQDALDLLQLEVRVNEEVLGSAHE